MSRNYAAIHCAALVLTMLALSITACADNPVLPIARDGRWLPDSTGEGLVAKPGSPIPDVPMPIGFVGIAAESHSSIDAGIRRVHHVYQGQAEVEPVAAFYRSQCRLHDWHWIDGHATASANRMTFDKGNEKLWINIDRRGPVTTATIVIDDRRLDEAPAPANAATPPKS